jgi:hypothetical protein
MLWASGKPVFPKGFDVGSILWPYALQRKGNPLSLLSPL